MMRIRTGLWTIAFCMVAFSANAQTVCLSSSLGARNIRYQEPGENDLGHPTLLNGATYTVPQIGLRCLAMDTIGIPFFLDIRASIPTATISSTEFGTLDSIGTEWTTQREDVKHSETNFSGRIGAVIREGVRVYGLLERYHLLSHRSNQQTGNNDGTLSAPDSLGYDESVWSTQVGGGVGWEFPIFSATDGLQLHAEASVPIAVFIRNTSPAINDDGTFAQGTTGYSLRAEVGFYHDLSTNLHFSVDFEYGQRHWNGDGELGSFPTRGHWPVNDEYIAELTLGIGYRFGSE